MRPEGGAGGRRPGQGLSRRSVLRGLGAGALATGAGGVLAACGSGGPGSGGSASGQTISIGFVTPLTGPLAGFASGDRFVLSKIKATPQYRDGFTIGGRTYKINILVADNQFLNLDPDNDSSLNLQQAFWITSHSGAATTVTYSGNRVEGASIGFKWLGDPEFPGQDYSAVYIEIGEVATAGIGFLVRADGRRLTNQRLSLRRAGVVEGEVEVGHQEIRTTRSRPGSMRGCG